MKTQFIKNIIVIYKDLEIQTIQDIIKNGYNNFQRLYPKVISGRRNKDYNKKKSYKINSIL